MREDIIKTLIVIHSRVNWVRFLIYKYILVLYVYVEMVKKKKMCVIIKGNIYSQPYYHIIFFFFRWLLITESTHIHIHRCIYTYTYVYGIYVYVYLFIFPNGAIYHSVKISHNSFSVTWVARALSLLTINIDNKPPLTLSIFFFFFIYCICTYIHACDCENSGCCIICLDNHRYVVIIR